MDTFATNALRNASQRLQRAGVENPGYDTTKLFESCLGKRIFAIERDELASISAEFWSRFEKAIKLREQRMPVAKITNEKEFWGRKFYVNSKVLDPRPETEVLIEEALDEDFELLLDLGTGSGCLLVSILTEKSNTFGIGADISFEGLEVARVNVERFGLTDRCKLVTSNWFSELNCKFDLIISNPPYITKGEYKTLQPEIKYFEPRIALTLEDDGLEAYRKIATDVSSYLNKNGRLIIEIGYGKYQKVKRIFEQTDLFIEKDIPDLDGVIRALVFRKL